MLDFYKSIVKTSQCSKHKLRETRELRKVSKFPE